MRFNVYTIKYFLFAFSLLSFSTCKRMQSQNLAGFDYQSFVDPPNEYRSHPFYSLNDELKVEELRRQIKDFKQAGFGGFYLHSRPGLLTEYLSEEWWEMMDAAVDAANEVGIRCMFYDEDKWPSGYAGGKIPDLGEEFRAKCLAKIDLETTAPSGSVILKKDSLYQYILYTAQYGYDIFNGTCYVDLYNPNAVQQFIESTHRPYFEKYGNKMEENALFIFTDEPHIHARYFDRKVKNYGTLSYSPYLEEKFKQRYGYSLRDQVDLLFEEKANWREVRWHYHTTKALLFEESFTRQIADFCDKYGAQLTGHYLGEDGLSKVRDRIGNSSLHYRSMQQPGIDHLGLSIANRVLTPKYLSSVANQYNKRSRLSELFGISGHNINFQERKWIGGWHAILGINHFCPHLTAYSMKGARKRDYPPTFSYHQPYWTYNKIIEDYLGRISYAATIGQYDPKVLVISPLESEYIRGAGEEQFTAGVLQLAETLQKGHIDYDLGDEQIIQDAGEVDGKKFVIGSMDYEYVILPEMLTIRESTLALLLQFHKNGGSIFFAGGLPQFVDAKQNEPALEQLKLAVKALPDQLVRFIPPSLHIEGGKAAQVWTQTRTLNGHKFYLIYNTSNVSSAKVTIQLAEKANHPVLWDPAKVKTFELPTDQDGDFSVSLGPAGFYWITTDDLSANIPTASLPDVPENLVPVQTIDSDWTGKRNDPNTLMLDFAAYSIDGGKTFSDPEPVIGIWNRLNKEQYKGDLHLKYFANIKSIPEYCALAMEQTAAFHRISVNGEPIQFSGNDYFIDQSIRTHDISERLKKGKNEIALQIAFSPAEPLNSEPIKRYGTELESIYLIGEFGVFAERIRPLENTQRNRSADLLKKPAYAFENYFIGRERDQFSGNVALEGYPFYAGSFSLTNSFELQTLDSTKSYFLDLSTKVAIATEVVINAQLVDILCWAPNRVDISSYLKKGKNTIQLHLVNSLRNLLGPHHHQGGELIKVGPNSFTGAGGFPDGRGEANWYDKRKDKEDLAIWTDTYYHIPFGLLGKVSILTQ